MQTIDINKVHYNPKLAIDYESAVTRSKKYGLRDRVSDMSLTDRLVEMVYNEYPRTEEEASVMMSRVWYIVENEISRDLDNCSTIEDIRDRIGVISLLYDLAVDKLNVIEKPLLRYGAVAEYYKSIY